VHDLGKINIPAEILTKPAKLTDLEYAIIKTHPQTGYDILRNVDFPWPIAEIVLQHHEKIDGSGYPNGLKGDAILQEAKILCVADVVESIMSHRPYRPALGVDAALDEIRAGRGRLFDPAVVDACEVVMLEQAAKPKEA
jgi:HD-GYP domain-containing protein (c-di-GMP phosphodiesterase class II)